MTEAYYMQHAEPMTSGSVKCEAVSADGVSITWVIPSFVSMLNACEPEDDYTPRNRMEAKVCAKRGEDGIKALRQRQAFERKHAFVKPHTTKRR